MSSRKRKATEQPEVEEKKVEAGHEYTVTGEDPMDDEDNSSKKVSVYPSKERIAAVKEANSKKNWAGELDSKNPNRNLATAYQWRYLPHVNTNDLFIAVDRPAERTGGNSAKKYKAGTVFTSFRFVCTPNELKAEFVFPISSVVSWGTSLQQGNFFKLERNKGKEMKYLGKTLLDSKKSIALSAEHFTREIKDKEGNVIGHWAPRKDDMGRNADFMDAYANIKKCARMIFEMLVSEEPKLKPGFMTEAENGFYADRAKGLQATYDALANQAEEQYKAEKLTADEYKRSIAAYRKKYYINKAGKVDEARLRAATPSSELVDALMSSCFTNKLKTDKNGVMYLNFDMNVTRNTTDLEKKGWDEKTQKIVPEYAPSFPDAQCRSVFIGSGGKKTINHHTFTDLSQWGKTQKIADLNVALTDKAREKKGIEEWNRVIDPMAKVGLKCELIIFTTSPQRTAGVRLEFKDVIYYSPPTPDEILSAKNRGSGGFQPKEEDKFEVGGAEDYATTELTKPPEVLDAGSVAKDVADAIARKAEEDAKGKKQDDEDAAMLAAAPA